MEILPLHPQQTVRRREVTMVSPTDFVALENTLQKLSGFTNLPELEITPIVREKQVLTEQITSVSKTESSSLRNTSGTETSVKPLTKEQGDIKKLLELLPVLNTNFRLYNKIGEGTFSTVYLATSRNSNDSKQYAVKHLTQNCQQSRIQRELRCMSDIGGTDNVVKADYCLNNGNDCCTFIMPYMPHKRFGDYVLDMGVKETQLYMKNLFIALRRVHSFNVIHRDVKPGNFLYNREKKQFLLVDFGLAQVLTKDEAESATPPQHDENMPIDYSQKRKRKPSGSDDKDATPVKRMALKPKDGNPRVGWPPRAEPGEQATRLRQDLASPVQLSTSRCETPLKPRILSPSGLQSSSRKKLFREESPGTEGARREGSLGTSMLRAQLEMKMLSPSERSFTPLVASKTSSGSFVQVRNSRVVRQHMMAASPALAFPRPSAGACPCVGKGFVCSGCAARKKMVAPRAGTPGFRPPEVLLKHPHQTTAVDMWASGVVLLCILSGCYPFFKSPNDLVALAEIISIFGTSAVANVAVKFGRRVVCSEHKEPTNLKELCVRLRRRLKRRAAAAAGEDRTPCENCTKARRCRCHDKAEEFPDAAYDLLARLLDLDPTTRLTAEAALDHPFVAGPE